jgi:hypothetical protein
LVSSFSSHHAHAAHASHATHSAHASHAGTGFCLLGDIADDSLKQKIYTLLTKKLKCILSSVGDPDPEPIRMVLGLLDPDPLVRGTVPDPVSDPDPAPDPSFPLPINVLSRLK